MKQQRTIMLLVAAILIVFTGSALAQENLGEVAKEYGFDWVFGTWTGTTDNGVEVYLVYKLDLDGNVVMVSIEMGQYALRGMIFKEPFEESATQVSVDNTGRKTEGTWELMGDRLIWKNKFADDMGNEQKLAIIYSKVDAQTMNVEILGVNESGQLSDGPGVSVEFNREVSKEK